jgi:hypothetical protein
MSGMNERGVNSLPAIRAGSDIMDAKRIAVGVMPYLWLVRYLRAVLSVL